MGGLQALSRSTYSKLIPKTEDTTSFFSFYGVTEKIGIIVGMSLFGVIDQITGSMRNAILIFINQIYNALKKTFFSFNYDIVFF